MSSESTILYEASRPCLPQAGTGRSFPEMNDLFLLCPFLPEPGTPPMPLWLDGAPCRPLDANSCFFCAFPFSNSGLLTPIALPISTSASRAQNNGGEGI